MKQMKDLELIPSTRLLLGSHSRDLKRNFATHPGDLCSLNCRFNNEQKQKLLLKKLLAARKVTTGALPMCCEVSFTIVNMQIVMTTNK